MHLTRALLVVTLTCFATQTDAVEDYFTAAVVEYAPQSNRSLDPEENIMVNVNNYVEFIRKASTQQVDIIVFPEIGLKGYGNQPYFSEIPNGRDAVTPCTSNTFDSKALVELSCTAKKYNMYVVVNIPEKYLNTTTGVTKHFNTDVVFDRNGTVVARYRKFNLFGESGTDKPELEYVYFDTDFGVRFGVFICFDMEFRDPVVTMAREYGIRHFVFSTAWYSELPFLTALQAQWSFSYSLDVVLLASGYNDPLAGSTGSGIFQGRDGNHSYFMTESHGSKMLVGSVLKKILDGSVSVPYVKPMCTDEACKKSGQISLVPLSDLGEKARESVTLQKDVYEKSLSYDPTNKLTMLQDALHLYETEPISGANICKETSCIEDYSSSVSLSYTTETELCQNDFCCLFNLTMTTVYNKTAPNNTKRGDDYNQLHYRLAVFNGVRTYSGYATGGIQVCAIIPCVDGTQSSCGLRSDHVKSKPIQIIDKTYGTLYQTKTTFDHIEIHSDFDYITMNSFIYPVILVRGDDDNFGALVQNEQFRYQYTEPFNGTAHYELITLKSLDNLVTFGIYGRQFDRDGDRDGESESIKDSSLTSICNTNFILIFILSLILLIKRP